MTPSEKQEFVRQVQEFATSDAVEVLLNRLEDKFTQDWKDTAPIDTTGRESAFHMVRAVDALRNEIKSVALGEAVDAWNRKQKSKIV